MQYSENVEFFWTARPKIKNTGIVVMQYMEMVCQFEEKANDPFSSGLETQRQISYLWWEYYHWNSQYPKFRYVAFACAQWKRAKRFKLIEWLWI